MFSFLRKNKEKKIFLTEDILKELSDKTGLELQLIEEVYKKNLEYIRKSILNIPEIVIISFPNLGKLRYNYYLAGCFKTRTKDILTKKRVEVKLKYLRTFLKEEKGNRLRNFNKPILFNAIGYLEGKFTRNVINNFYNNWKKLEDKHNEDHQKYFK